MAREEQENFFVLFRFESQENVLPFQRINKFLNGKIFMYVHLFSLLLSSLDILYLSYFVFEGVIIRRCDFHKLLVL